MRYVILDHLFDKHVWKFGGLPFTRCRLILFWKDDTLSKRRTEKNAVEVYRQVFPGDRGRNDVVDKGNVKTTKVNAPIDRLVYLSISLTNTADRKVPKKRNFSNHLTKFTRELINRQLSCPLRDPVIEHPGIFGGVSSIQHGRFSYGCTCKALRGRHPWGEITGY